MSRFVEIKNSVFNMHIPSKKASEYIHLITKKFNDVLYLLLKFFTHITYALLMITVWYFHLLIFRTIHSDNLNFREPQIRVFPNDCTLTQNFRFVNITHTVPYLDIGNSVFMIICLISTS